MQTKTPPLLQHPQPAKLLLAGLFFLILLTAACTRSNADTPSTATLPPVDIATDAPTQSPAAAPATPTPLSLATEVAGPASPTATALPAGLVDPVCVNPQSVPIIEETSFENYPDVFLRHLNLGGSVAELNLTLSFYELSQFAQPAIEADLTGDGKQDIIVTLNNVNSVSLPPEGALLIYTCLGSQFALSYNQPSQSGYGAPLQLLARDLNGDNVNDLVVSSPSCGAHTCFEDTHILVWTGNGFENRLRDSTQEIPFPNIQVTDYDQNGTYDLEVAGGGFGSVGAGPQRETTYTWAHDPATGYWESSGQTLGPSQYRIHIIHDADAALQRGEYQIAQLLYDQVLYDPNLKDWLDPPTEQAYLGAYARFKTVVAYALQNDVAAAETFLGAMNQLYPPGSLQHGYAQMAAMFLAAFQTGGQDAACAAAITYAELNAAAVLDPIGPKAFGYANPEYTPPDICP